MTPRPEGDGRAREIIRSNLSESLVVEASAGTGKTTELVHRIVAVLRAGLATIDRIVAVTFTHKAAGELKVRLRQELDVARESARGDELRHLEHAIEHLEEASIGTIHSFCAQVLRERPVEAGVDPAFKELADQEQQRIFDRAFRSWFEWALEADRPGVRRALTRLAWDSGAKSKPPSDQLRYDGWKFIEWRDFTAPWKSEPFDRIEEMRELGKAVKRLSKMRSQAARETDELVLALRCVRDVHVWIDNVSHRRRPDYDAVEAVLLKLFKDMKRNKKKGRGRFSDTVLREDVQRARETLMLDLERFKRKADAELASALQTDMRELLTRYERLKRRAGVLDFVDLLVKTRDMLRGNSEVREYLQRRFTHLFVDEFQDTDPVQAEIIVLLAAADARESDWRKTVPAPGKLFVVGDPKQSIYKFRRADVLMYQDVRDRLVEGGAQLVHLSTSHRSLRPIQQCVNGAFEREMTGSRDHGQADYVPLEGNREPIDGQPSVVVLPVPFPYWVKTIEETQPDATAAFVEWLLRDSGWKVRAPGEETLVPIEARHIAILFRRRVNFGQDVTRPYVRCLEARNIRHLLVGSKSFHQREEVETLRTACAAIEWPTDELSVYATLKGPLFAIPDALLLRFRLEVGRLHPLRPEPTNAADCEPIEQALETLAMLHRNRNRHPVAETVNAILEATRAHAGFAVRPGGHQVLSNVYRLIDLARTFETGGGTSFRAFFEMLEERGARADSNEAPLVEESADGVRIMTVHTAKGLEFPIVILADMTAKLSQAPERYIDTDRGLAALKLSWCSPLDLSDHEDEEQFREDAEGVRVAYVAATRARDLLVVPASGEEQRQGWLSPLNKAIYPELGEWRKARLANGCPKFGDRSALPDESADQGSRSVRPGLHQPCSGAHEVVWWDPAALKLRVDAKLGVGIDNVLEADGGAAQAAYDAWSASRHSAIEHGSVPAFEIANPTDMPDAPRDMHVELTATGVIGERPLGPRFGTMVHAILRDSVLDPELVAASAKMHGRSSGASDAEITEAAIAVEAALEHRLLRQARSATRCLREVPVSLRIDDAHIMEGNIDLAFEDAEGWHIVDYKTDSPSGALLGKYQRQVAWYGVALSRITNKPVRCYLLTL